MTCAFMRRRRSGLQNVESEDVDFFFSRSDEKGTNKVPKMRLSIERRVVRTRIYFLWQRDDEAKSARTCQKSVDENVKLISEQKLNGKPKERRM